MSNSKTQFANLEIKDLFNVIFYSFPENLSEEANRGNLRGEAENNSN